MAVTAQSSAPYTAGSAILSVIRRFRERGLSTPINAEVLVRAGVSETLVPRTLPALVTLELIDDKGEPTQTFQKIRTVPEADYQTCLADWLRSVYADVFSFVDPAKDDAIRVRDAFRSYVPTGQQDRMVALFLALCAEAGIVSEVKKSEPKPATRKPYKVYSGVPVPPKRGKTIAIVSPPQQQQNGLDPALAGILQSIPSPQMGWTQETRDKFLTTFGAVLDFVIPIKSAAQINLATDEEAPDD